MFTLFHFYATSSLIALKHRLDLAISFFKGIHHLPDTHTHTHTHTRMHAGTHTLKYHNMAYKNFHGMHLGISNFILSEMEWRLKEEK